jgi:hypothetical protein
VAGEWLAHLEPRYFSNKQRLRSARPLGEKNMLKLIAGMIPRSKTARQPLTPLRSTRPSLLDVRFTGDPWVVDQLDGTASLRLDNYRLARIQTLPFDVPSLNHLLFQLRQWQMRRCLARRRRTQERAASSEGREQTAISPSSLAACPSPVASTTPHIQ